MCYRASHLLFILSFPSVYKNSTCLYCRSASSIILIDNRTWFTHSVIPYLNMCLLLFSRNVITVCRSSSHISGNVCTVLCALASRRCWLGVIFVGKQIPCWDHEEENIFILLIRQESSIWRTRWVAGSITWLSLVSEHCSNFAWNHCQYQKVQISGDSSIRHWLDVICPFTVTEFWILIAHVRRAWRDYSEWVRGQVPGIRSNVGVCIQARHSVLFISIIFSSEIPRDSSLWL